LAKEVTKLYNENFETYNEDFEQDSEKWKDLPCSWISRFNVL
jgi:hypothetical protein